MGNLLYKDEGIGVHVIHKMQQMSLPSHLELLDIGTFTMDLLSYLKDVKKLIVIDAMKAGGDPGTVYRCKPEDLIPKGQDTISLHEIGLLESLKMAKKMGFEMETVVIGVEPKIFEWGLELSEEVQASIPRIIEAVLKES